MSLNDLHSAIPPESNSSIDFKPASQISVIAAYIVDFVILLFPRIFTLVFFQVFSNKSRLELFETINREFGSISDISFANKEEINLILHSDYCLIICIAMLSMVAIGVIYRMIMWMSSWHATLGQRFVNTMVVSVDSCSLTFSDVFSRITLLYLGWLFPVLVLVSWSVSRALSIIFLVLTSIWTDSSFLFGKKTTMPDAISGTTLVYGKKAVVFKLFH